MDHERYFQNKLSEFEAEENIKGRITKFYPNTLYVLLLKVIAPTNTKIV